MGSRFGTHAGLLVHAPNQCNDQHGRGNAGAFCNFDPISNGKQAGLNPGLIYRGDVTVQRLVTELVTTWEDRVQGRLISACGEADGRRLFERYLECFRGLYRESTPPEEVPEGTLPAGDPIHLPALLVEQLGIGSTSEARRLIEQGGVRLDGEPVTELDVPRTRLEGATLQAGKRRFARFRAG